MLKHIYILFNYSLENESIGSCKKLNKLSSILKSDTYEYNDSNIKGIPSLIVRISKISSLKFKIQFEFF